MESHTDKVNPAILQESDNVWMSLLSDRINEAIADWEEANNKDFVNVDFAAACGVTRASVGDWRKGRTKRIIGSTLLKAADYLNVSPSWLGEGKGDKAARFTDNQSSGSPSEPQSMHNYISLDSSKLAWSLEVMDQVLARTYDDPRDAEYDTRADVFAVAWREVNRDPQITQLKKETAVRYVEQQLEANNNG